MARINTSFYRAHAILYIFVALYYHIEASKVIELDERLPDLIKRDPSRAWVINFYAPWCHYCKNLEPTYDNVAEAIYHKHDHLLVGRLDCSKYSTVCQNFDIKSFPTIKFISHERLVSYEGERFADAIVKFAERLHGPDIRIADCSTLNEMKNKHGVIFVANIKDKSDPMWDDYKALAKNLITANWFFEVTEDCTKLFGHAIGRSGIFILKANRSKIEVYETQISREGTESPSQELVRWAKKNRLAYFSRISNANINQALQTGKMLVLAIVDEYLPLRRLHPTSQEFVDMLIGVSREFEAHDDKLLFGWTGDLDTINSIALQTISLIPNLIVLTPNLTYYMIDSPKDGQVTPSKTSVQTLLRDIVEQKPNLRAYGGDSIYHHILRGVYDLFAAITRMYQGNPILTLLLMVLPCLFLSGIVYTACCSADEEETEPLVKRKTNDDKED